VATKSNFGRHFFVFMPKMLVLLMVFCRGGVFDLVVLFFIEKRLF
jgi:hypothetical protein